jgi:hypothetical protein
MVKKFLFNDGEYVVAHLDPSLFMIKTVPDRVTAMNLITHSRGWWVGCGTGQRGWVVALERIDFELAEQARAASRREAQLKLFGSALDERTDQVVASLKRQLDDT